MLRQIVQRHDELDFYRQQSNISSAGRFNPLFDNLPTSIADLCKVVQNLLLHQFWIQDEKNYGITARSLLNTGRNLNSEINLRSAEEMLEFLIRINDQPLTASREPQERVVGNCRDYALLLVSMLRHQGVPARMRSGVARYFYPKEREMLEDHFICEFWNDVEDRWQRVDPQVDDVQREVLKTTLDMTDLPNSQFLDAGESYYELKSEKVKPERIGIFEFRGWQYVHYKLVSDLACINSVEVLPWESWGIIDRIDNSNLSEDDENLLEEITRVLAELRDHPDHFRQARELYSKNPDLRVPRDYEPFHFELPLFE